MARLSLTKAPNGSKASSAGKSIRSKSTLSGLEFFGLSIFLLLPLALPAIWSGQLQQYLPPQLQAYFAPAAKPKSHTVAASPESILEACPNHQYTSDIVSLDPLVIYINNFISIDEANELIKLGEDDFQDSFISRSRGGNQKVIGRTSQSAPLPVEHPLVECILSRARKFMGSMLQPYEPWSVPQLVRYFPSQKYDLHTDFWPQHQVIGDGSNRLFNRVASFFVFMRDNCTQGETYFPAVDVLDKDADRGGNLESLWEGRASRGEIDGEKKGVKFKPITGNAVFWVNIDEEGNGDRRLVHAGLPVGEGEKIGMNLWPRKFYGVEGEEVKKAKKKPWSGNWKQ